MARSVIASTKSRIYTFETRWVDKPSACTTRLQGYGNMQSWIGTTIVVGLSTQLYYIILYSIVNSAYRLGYATLYNLLTPNNPDLVLSRA